MRVGNVPEGRIIQTSGRWGVVMGDGPRKGGEYGGGKKKRYRIVDFWLEGREKLPADLVVEVQVGKGGGVLL